MKVSIRSVVLGLVVAFAANAFGQPELIVNLAGSNGVSFGGMIVATPDVPSLAGATVFDLMVTAPDDLLVIDYELNVAAGTIFQETTAEFFGTPLYSDVSAPNEQAFAQFPALAADSWITTGGGTSNCAPTIPNPADPGGPEICAGFENAGQMSHFDTDTLGAPQDFVFARITLMPDERGDFDATLTGEIQVRAAGSPLRDSFSFSLTTVPEPAAMGLLMTAFLGCLSMIRRKRNS